MIRCALKTRSKIKAIELPLNQRFETRSLLSRKIPESLLTLIDQVPQNKFLELFLFSYVFSGVIFVAVQIGQIFLIVFIMTQSSYFKIFVVYFFKEL